VGAEILPGLDHKVEDDEGQHDPEADAHPMVDDGECVRIGCGAGGDNVGSGRGKPAGDDGADQFAGQVEWDAPGLQGVEEACDFGA
jgi:hypothetical protein